MTSALRTCPMCEATCGLVLTLETARITGVRGDDLHPLSRGYLCPKGAAFGELDHDPSRLDSPRIRIGETWHNVSWTEAFAFVNERLATIDRIDGRNALAVYLGNPSFHGLAGQLYNAELLRGLRPDVLVTVSTVDQMPKNRSSAELFGDHMAIPVPDIDRTDLLVVIGANPMMSNGSLWTVPDFPRRVRALRARGGRLIVVDPRRSRTAERADTHLAIRPGMDAMLMAAVVQQLLATDRADLGTMRHHVRGLDDLAAAVKDFSPGAVAAACGLEASQIRGLVDELCSASTAAIYGRIGTTTTRFGTLTSWLIDVVNILTGNLDRPGGAMFPRPFHEDRSSRKPPQFGRFRSRVSGHPEFLGELPAACLSEEITTPGHGQVRALVVVAGNPVLSTPGGHRLADALDQLDLMVSVDPYLTATSQHADVILPPPPHRYRGHADLVLAPFMVRQVVQYTPPVLPLPSHLMSEEEILLRLSAIGRGQGANVDADELDDLVAERLADQLASRSSARTGAREGAELLRAVAPRRGPERLLDLLLRSGPYGDVFGDDPQGLSLDRLAEHPHGVDLGPLEPRIGEVVVHSDQLVHLAPPELINDLDRLRQAQHATREDFLLVGRRHLRTNNSWMHNLSKLRGKRPMCTVQIGAEDAESVGLGDGDLARVWSADGAVDVPVEVVDHLRRGVVSLPHGFGGAVIGPDGEASPDDEVGVNVNRLMSCAAIDPLSGTSELNAVTVRIAPA